MPRYVGLFTMHCKVAFDAPDDAAAGAKAEHLGTNENKLAFQARIQQGWMGTDFVPVALHRANEYDEPEEVVYEWTVDP